SGEWRRVENPVNERDRNEHAGQPVEGPPSLVAAKQSTRVTEPGKVPHDDDARPDEAWQDRPPARDDCPHNERQQSERSNDAEGFPGSTRGGSLRQQNVRNKEHNPRDRGTAVPYRRSIDAVEPHLHPRQGADQDERDREEKDRLGTTELSDVAGASLTERPQREPDCYPSDHEDDNGCRTGVTRSRRAV